MYELVWQYFAAFIVVMFSLIGAIGIIRLTRIPMIVLVLSLLGIPVLGFAAFALAPQPLGHLNVAYAAAPFLGVAFSLIVARIVLMLPRRRARSFASIHRGMLATIVFWPLMVIGISDLLFIFEPWFAVANLAVNALWFCIWIPPATRRYSIQSSYEIAAPRHRVFAFLTDPANWPAYREGLESVDVRPPGPLAVGSEVTMRQKAVYRGLRGPRLFLPDTIEATSVITGFVPDVSMASRRKDGPESRDWFELSSADGRTKVRTAGEIRLPYRYAVLGMRLLIARERAAGQAKIVEARNRLKRLLEEPAAAG